MRSREAPTAARPATRFLGQISRDEANMFVALPVSPRLEPGRRASNLTISGRRIRSRGRRPESFQEVTAQLFPFRL